MSDHSSLKLKYEAWVKRFNNHDPCYDDHAGWYDFASDAEELLEAALKVIAKLEKEVKTYENMLLP